MKLNVVVLPMVPVITDETGAVVEGEAGPYTEGGRVVLTCKTIGGRPPPTLVWIRDGQVVEDSFNGDSRGQVRNLLHLESLSRDFLDVQFTCRASNNNITRPLDTSVKINITLAPLNVRLRRLDGPQEFVVSGRVERLECVTVGSRPDPEITWWKNGEEIHSPKTEDERTPNMTKSILRLEASPKDLGIIITCRVENKLLPNAVLEESYKLNVVYVPLVSLKMGFGLDPTGIREGSDVFMECNVTSNPKAFTVTWLHEGKAIEHNLSEGVIVSNQTLVLQKVEKERKGPYQCRASNARGMGTSRPIHLNIMYAPLCKFGIQPIYQVARHITTNISCEVNAQPKNVSFRWQFNNSGGILELKQDKIHTRGTSSVLSYTPTSQGDYGLLICSAENIIGKQEVPCVFNVTAASPPELLESCVIRNQSSHSVFVTCKNVPTELPMTFTMEVHTSDDLKQVTRVRNNTPAFVASGLTPGTAYVLHIGVKTPMGVSAPIKLRAFTVKTAEKRMGISEKGKEDSLGLLPIILGGLASICVMIGLLFIVTIRICWKRRQGISTLSWKSASPTRENVPPKASHKEALSSPYHCHSPVSEDKNPDLIPLKNECEYHLEELRVPTNQDRECSSQVASKVISSMAPSCYSVPIQALSHISQRGHDSFYPMHLPEVGQDQRVFLSTPHQSSPTFKQHPSHHIPVDPSKIRLEECTDLPTMFGVDPTLSNAPPFPPPEGFRGNGAENHCLQGSMADRKGQNSTATEEEMPHESSV